MKKFVLIMVCILLTFNLSGCSSAEKDEEITQLNKQIKKLEKDNKSLDVRMR